MKSLQAALLLAGTSLAAAPAFAQPAAPSADQARIEQLEAQVKELTRLVGELQKSTAKATPTWRGAPQFEDKPAGWTFKPRGRLMIDVGAVENPDEDVVLNRNLGFNHRVRRARLGVEGTIPGGFGYKFEMDFAGAQVGFGDAILTYKPKDQPWDLTLGNFETLNGLEQISSSRYISFMERAAFNDAFINSRRLGVSLGVANRAGDLRLGAGLFAAHSIDNSFDNDGWIAATRGVWSPKVGGHQLHLGASAQWREFQSNNGATVSNSVNAPSTNQQARYQARPFSQTTNVRFVDTGAFAAKSDRIFGIEAAGIFKSFHLAGEAQWIKVHAYRRGDRFTEANDFFPAASFLVPAADPSFWGGYLEAGYYLTGETRGYRNGLWDRTKVLNPFSKGGWGAVQVNGRVEYLDLDSERLKSAFLNNFATGASAASVDLTRGGKQLGLLGNLVWIPEDYLRLYLQYARARITGGPFSDEAFLTSSRPYDRRRFGIDVWSARASFDF